jgi:hypothetical protein
VIHLVPGIVALEGQPVPVLVLLRDFLADCRGAGEFDGVAVILELVESGEDFLITVGLVIKLQE